MGFHLMTALELRRLFSVSAHIRLLNNESTIEAGQSVHVNALPTAKGVGTSFGSGDAITSHIEWNFNDPSGAYNHLPGFTAAHVYEKPGKYKVILRCHQRRGPDGYRVADHRGRRSHPSDDLCQPVGQR